MSLPFVSIVVPAYNHEAYVLQALDSMLDSGVPDLEIVICDDASTDQTPQLIEQWQQQHSHRFRRIEFIQHEQNVGLCATMNDLVTAARGDLIILIAIDDYFLPGGILAKAQAMVDHPEWKVSFCDGQAVGLKGEIYLPSIVAASKFLPERLTPAGMGEELLYHWGNPVHQLTWRREIFAVHGGEFAYDPTVFCEDYDSAVWAAGKGFLGYLPTICQAYRLRSWPQTTNRLPLREFRDNAHVLAKHAHLFPPRVAQGYRLLSKIYFLKAINDPTENLLWDQHNAAAAAYRARDTSTKLDTAAEEPDHDTYLRALETQLMEVLGKCENQANLIAFLEERLVSSPTEMHKQELRALKAERKELKRQVADLEKQGAELAHRLRYHATNPLRALKLWWKR
jgi:glycosyltransferase involved in cell wall biosynthesis